MRQDRAQFVPHPRDRASMSRRGAPPKPCAIVGACTREGSDLAQDVHPTERRCGDAGFEEHHRLPVAFAPDVQTLSFDRDHHTRRRVPVLVETRADDLIQDASRQHEGPRRDDDDHSSSLIQPSHLLATHGEREDRPYAAA